jgi:hypothetical protein
MFGSAINFKSNSEVTSFVINDRYNQPNLWAQSPFYYIFVQNVDGLYGSDLSIESHPMPNFIGEKSGDIFRRGKTITLSGTIQAMSLGALERGAEFLQQMFTETLPRKLIWTRWADGVQVYYIARVNQDLSISQAISDKSYRYNYTVAVRADDPRTYKVSDNTVYPTFQA